MKTKQNKTNSKKQKELIRPTECSDVLVPCSTGVSVNIFGAAEVPKEQGLKMNSSSRLTTFRHSRSCPFLC